MVILLLCCHGINGYSLSVFNHQNIKEILLMNMDEKDEQEFEVFVSVLRILDIFNI